MITLILASHSRQIAEGVRELAAQMAPAELTLVAVGGVETAAGLALGCDATAIAAAIEAHASPDGILILADLGSSVMSAETALELVSSELAARCCVSNAPLVEGAIVAAVEAGLGHDLGQVNRAAEAVAQLTKVSRTLC